MPVEGRDERDGDGEGDDCLLQKSGEVSCVDQPLMKPEPFTDYLELTYLYFGDEGCESNWNNFSMNMVSYHTFLMYEHELPVRRAAHQNGIGMAIVGIAATIISRIP